MDIFYLDIIENRCHQVVTVENKGVTGTEVVTEGVRGCHCIEKERVTSMERLSYSLMGVGPLHVCEMCEALTVRWIQWSNCLGLTHFFCDGDCLGRWLERTRRDVCYEIAQEYLGRDLDDPMPSDFVDQLEGIY